MITEGFLAFSRIEPVDRSLILLVVNYARDYEMQDTKKYFPRIRSFLNAYSPMRVGTLR